jgi:nickel transport protein
MKKSVLSTKIIVSFLVFSVSCLLPALSYAHKVNVYGYAEDGKVFVEGYFVDGSRTKNSLVEIFDAETGEKLLEGKTDDKGTFSFKIPKLTSLKLVLTASMGHKNDYTISREEVAEAMGGETTEAKEEKIVRAEELEKVVERVMERELKPIKNMLLQIQEVSARPGITEVFGGIGYIIGLMGIVLYFKSKSRR